MKNIADNLTCEIEVRPGETLTLPQSLVDQVGVGSWIITIQPKPKKTEPVRSHNAFLSGYAIEDEGLYDDYPIG
ncbi:hypothetical protein Xen7305DRAFT_00000190 [Xenococcus sp. PCC 7305]|uniref:hypothetical protein n=1 Tax=Xenococcus sp. PCC 7305 TaxID=102125 RepID=UPI0002ABE309|nr:hypothetical protein [Xenococcus sp. PCC 7305]ELS00319.1 hypothetical protein Xen7305DRAFT_00000190 [Xenococcus sp. PCC 7305]